MIVAITADSGYTTAYVEKHATVIKEKSKRRKFILEQLAGLGESCIFCSYEMSYLELLCKSAARRLFLQDKNTTLTAVDIQRGGRLNNLIPLSKISSILAVKKIFKMTINRISIMQNFLMRFMKLS